MDDTISRAKAIAEVEKARAYVGHRYNIESMVGRDIFEMLDNVGLGISKLPSAQPDVPDINVGDTISRQAAIDGKICIRRSNGVEIYDDYVVPVEYLEQLPPAQPAPSQVAKDIARIVENEQDMMVIAQPEIIRCKDCKHWIPYDWMFSEVWQSKNIADYPEDEIGCNYCDAAMKANDFCSRGERRTE